MTVATLVRDLEGRSVRLITRDGRLIVDAPKGTLSAEEVEELREHKAEILTVLANPASDSGQAANEALALLQRLKGYVLPQGRMPVVCAMVQRLHSLTDPAAILNALRVFERELAALGGRYAPELAAGVEMVEAAFPGASLVKVTQYVH